jgi:hypothetical protein
MSQSSKLDGVRAGAMAWAGQRLGLVMLRVRVRAS